MNTTEGNKLIAEFMGWTSRKSSDAGILGGSITYWKDPETGRVGYSYPDKYHTSWDWLMPVVEKISTMPICFNVSISIMFDGCVIFDDDYKRTGQGVIFRGGINGRYIIDSVWNAVIQFIQYYNSKIK